MLRQGSSALFDRCLPLIQARCGALFAFLLMASRRFCIFRVVEQHNSAQDEIDSMSLERLELRERLEALEARVAALESAAPRDTSTRDFWVVDGIETAHQARSNTDAGEPRGTCLGSVVFAGSVSVGGRKYSYQWERSAEYLTSHAWDEYVERIAAITHPVRGAILRRLLSAPATVAELVEESVVSSTGTGYHHVGALQDTGWIVKLDGRYEVRPSRVVPLLTIIASGEDH